MNKVGIALCGSYLPKYRIDRNLIAASWGRSSLGGERTVANNDEDAITMAVEAARNCLRGNNREEIDGLFLATTSAPYKEKMNSAVMASALDLNRELVTADFGHSLRAGTGALKAAFDSVRMRFGPNRFGHCRRLSSGLPQVRPGAEFRGRGGRRLGRRPRIFWPPLRGITRSVMKCMTSGETRKIPLSEPGKAALSWAKAIPIPWSRSSGGY